MSSNLGALARRILVNCTVIPVPVQVALAADYPELVHNDHVAREAMAVLVDRDLSADEATVLFQRARFSAPVLRTIATRERRSQPLTALLETNADLVDDALIEAMGPKIPDAAASFALGSPTVSLETKMAVAPRAKGMDRLEWMVATSPTDLPDAELMTLFEGFDRWAPKSKKSRRAALCSMLAALRPVLLPQAVGPTAHDSFATAAAGAHTFTDPALQRQLVDAAVSANVESYALMALSANPACDPTLRQEIAALNQAPFLGAARNAASLKVHQDRPVALIEDSEVLTTLMRRALPSLYRHRGRPALMLALAHNRHLEAIWVKALTEELTKVFPPTAPAWALDPARRALEEHYGLQPGQAGSNDDAVMQEWDNPWDYSQEKLEGDRRTAAMNLRVEDLRYARSPNVDVLGEALGDDPTVWRLAFTLVDGFQGTIADLVTTCHAACS